ncbi:unnamed protein product [Discosporangium mesarthrocarpum]
MGRASGVKHVFIEVEVAVAVAVAVNVERSMFQRTSTPMRRRGLPIHCLLSSEGVVDWWRASAVRLSAVQARVYPGRCGGVGMKLGVAQSRWITPRLTSRHAVGPEVVSNSCIRKGDLLGALVCCETAECSKVSPEHSSCAS